MRLRPPPRATETRSPTHRGMTDASSITGVDVLLGMARQSQEEEAIDAEATGLFEELLVSGFVRPPEHITTAETATSREIAQAELNDREWAACRIVAASVLWAVDHGDRRLQGEVLSVGLGELVKYREYLASMNEPYTGRRITD
jgi:hypothetical protein